MSPNLIYIEIKFWKIKILFKFNLTNINCYYSKQHVQIVLKKLYNKQDLAIIENFLISVFNFVFRIKNNNFALIL